MSDKKSHAGPNIKEGRMWPIILVFAEAKEMHSGRSGWEDNNHFLLLLSSSKCLNYAICQLEGSSTAIKSNCY